MPIGVPSFLLHFFVKIYASIDLGFLPMDLSYILLSTCNLLHRFRTEYSNPVTWPTKWMFTNEFVCVGLAKKCLRSSLHGRDMEIQWFQEGHVISSRTPTTVWFLGGFYKSSIFGHALYDLVPMIVSLYHLGKARRER